MGGRRQPQPPAVRHAGSRPTGSTATRRPIRPRWCASWARRFGNYVPPVLEALGLAEVEHNARNNRMRAL
jgi:hypothetical protein